VPDFPSGKYLKYSWNIPPGGNAVLQGEPNPLKGFCPLSEIFSKFIRPFCRNRVLF